MACNVEYRPALPALHPRLQPDVGPYSIAIRTELALDLLAQFLSKLARVYTDTSAFTLGDVGVLGHGYRQGNTIKL